jgi:16S rRNA (cytosine967-C5)-methyltransferase
MQQMEITPFLPDNLEDSERAGAMSLWTHKIGTDAMYLALFKKIAE